MNPIITNFKTLIGVTGLLVALGTTGCKKEAATVETQPPTSVASVETLTDFLSKTTGADKVNISYDEQKGLFAANEDLLISKDELQKHYDKNQSAGANTEHWRGTYLVSNAYITNVKVRNSVSNSSWSNALVSAINNWNASNVSSVSKLRFTFVSSGQDITVTDLSNEASGWVARAYLPSSNGRPGATVEINRYHDGLGQSTKVFALTHELGHNIGLLHTNQNQGVFIQGTPASDPNSVMNSFVLPWNGFTSGDVTAIRILYPR